VFCFAFISDIPGYIYWRVYTFYMNELSNDHVASADLESNRAVGHSPDKSAKSKRHFLTYKEAREKGLWFKAKWLGWGWTPVCLEGWAVTILCVALLVREGGEFDFRMSLHVPGMTLIAVTNLLVGFVGITALFLIICYAKGEVPGWRWFGDER